MIAKLSSAWSRLNAQTIGSDAYWWIALESRAFYEDMAPVISRWVRGLVLDLGAGRLAWKDLLMAKAENCVAVDVTRQHPDLDAVVDATEMLPFRDEVFDVVFCCSVLEHAPEPWKTFPEIFRVLKNGGTAIISLPFVLHLHDAPDDFYRFTRFGIERLATSAGFEVIETVANGGLFHLFLNIPSIIMSVCLEFCGLRALIRPTTSFWLGIARLMDGAFRLKTPFASNHISVLRKNGKIVEQQRS